MSLYLGLLGLDPRPSRMRSTSGTSPSQGVVQETSTHNSHPGEKRVDVRVNLTSRVSSGTRARKTRRQTVHSPKPRVGNELREGTGPKRSESGQRVHRLSREVSGGTRGTRSLVWKHGEVSD